MTKNITSMQTTMENLVIKNLRMTSGVLAALFFLFASFASAEALLSSLENRNIMIKNGDYFLIQTADSPLKAVSLEPDNDFCFRVMKTGSVYTLYYGSKGQGSRRLVLQNMQTGTPTCNIQATISANDVDTFRIYSPANETRFLIQRGEYFVGVGPDFGLIVGKLSDVSANPNNFLFTIKLAEEVLAAAGVQIQLELDMAKAAFNDQVAQAAEQAKQALMAQMKVAVDNASDADNQALQKKITDLQNSAASLAAETANTQAEADDLAKQVAMMEATRQAESTKAGTAVAEIQKSMTGMDPNSPEYAAAQQQIQIMQSSKEQMVQRLDDDSKTIAANKKRNIELSMQVAQLVQQKAKAETDAANQIELAIAAAQKSQEDRTAALGDAFKAQRDEIQKQNDLLQQQIDQVSTENDAMRKALAQLSTDQAKTQEDRNAKIAQLQGLVYAPDIITTDDIKGALKQLLPDQAAAIDTLSRAALQKMAYDESQRVLEDKQKLVAELETQMETLASQAKTISVNTQQIQAQTNAAASLDQAKAVAETQTTQAINDTTDQIKSLVADMTTFENAVLAQIASVNGAITASSTDVEKANASSQETAYRQSIAQKKDETQAKIQALVNQTNASFNDLAALIDKDISDLRAQKDSLTQATQDLVDKMTKGGSNDTDVANVQSDYKTKAAALDDQISKAVGKSEQLLTDKQTFNNAQLDRSKQWDADARALVDNQVNALTAQLANQSASLQDATQKQIAALKQQSQQQLATVQASQQEAINQMQAQFDANQKIQQAQIADKEKQIADATASGQAAVAQLQTQLANVTGSSQAEQDDARKAIQAKIDAAKNASIDLISKLEDEHKQTLNALNAKLDERKQMQQDYINELQDRKTWAEAAAKKELDLLQSLYNTSSADQQAKYKTAMDSTQTGYQASIDKLNQESAKSIADIQAQIADQQKSAADEQVRLQAQLDQKQQDYAADLEKERQRIEGLIGQERTDAQKTLDDLQASQKKQLADLQTNMDTQVENAKKAEADAAAANELKLSLLQTQFADVAQLQVSVQVTDGEQILIQQPKGSKFLMAAAGQASLQAGSRFDPKFRLKIAKEDHSKISIRTVDDALALTVTGTAASFQAIASDATGAKTIDPVAQAFFLEGSESQAVIRVTDASNKKVGLLAIDSGGSTLVVQQTGDGFVWIKNISAGAGTIESLLLSLYTDTSIESTQRAITMADTYFMSNRIFNQPDLMQDFAGALNEFVEAKDAAHLLNESAAQALGLLMDKMDRFVMQAGDTSDTRGKVEIDSAVLASLNNSKMFLDPIALKAGDVICIKKDECCLSNQSQKDPSGKTVVSFLNGKLYDPAFALKVVDGGAPNTYALETEAGALRLTYQDGDLQFAAAKEAKGSPIDATQLFIVEGTRAAATFKTADGGFITIGKVAGSNSTFFVHMTKAEVDAAQSSPQPLAPASFQIDIFESGLLEFDFITKGLSSYQDDADSRAAIGAIADAVRTRLFNQALANPDKVDALQKFGQYLVLYVTDTSLLDWARSTNSLVDAAKQQLPNADPQIFATILKSIQAFALQDGTYLMLQSIYDAAPDRQGSNSYVVADLDAKTVVSKVVEQFDAKVIFRVVARGSNTAALVAANGNYLDATDAGIVISQTAAVGADQKPVEPSATQLFKIMGSGTTITIQSATGKGGDDVGYVVIDANNRFTQKNAESLDQPFYTSSNLRAKFKVEVLTSDSMRYELIVGDFNKMPALFFQQLYQIAESQAADADKTAQAKQVLSTFVTMATDSIAGTGTDTSSVTLKIKDNMVGLKNIPDQEDQGIYPIGKALDFVKRYALYDENLRKTGIKFDAPDTSRFAMLEKLFPSPGEQSNAALPVKAAGGANIKAITDPSGKGTDDGEYLVSLWQDKTNQMAGVRILHAYLTKAARVIYGDTFEDNTDLFGMDELGQIKDGDKVFMATQLTQTFTDDKGVTFYKVGFTDSANEPLTKTIDVPTPAVLDENGKEITPAATIKDSLELGISLAVDATKNPVFSMRPGQSLRLNPDLEAEDIATIKTTLTNFGGSTSLIIKDFLSAQDLIKTLVASLSGIKKADDDQQLTVLQKGDAALLEAMKLHLSEQYSDADAILGKCKPYSGTDRQTIGAALWNEGDPIYLLRADQLKNWATIKKNNTKKMLLRKRADAATAAAAKAAAAAAARAAAVKAKKDAAAAKKAQAAQTTNK